MTLQLDRLESLDALEIILDEELQCTSGACKDGETEGGCSIEATHICYCPGCGEGPFWCANRYQDWLAERYEFACFNCKIDQDEWQVRPI